MEKIFCDSLGFCPFYNRYVHGSIKHMVLFFILLSVVLKNNIQAHWIFWNLRPAHFRLGPCGFYLLPPLFGTSSQRRTGEKCELLREGTRVSEGDSEKAWLGRSSVEASQAPSTREAKAKKRFLHVLQVLSFSLSNFVRVSFSTIPSLACFLCFCFG